MLVVLRYPDGEELESLRIERSKTFRHLAGLASRHYNRNMNQLGKFFFQGMFLTLDPEGKQAPGKFDAPIGDQLSDGQVLFASYLKICGSLQRNPSPVEGPDCFACGRQGAETKFATTLTAMRMFVLCPECREELGETGHVKGKRLRCCFCAAQNALQLTGFRDFFLAHCRSCVCEGDGGTAAAAPKVAVVAPIAPRIASGSTGRSTRRRAPKNEKKIPAQCTLLPNTGSTLLKFIAASLQRTAERH